MQHVASVSLPFGPDEVVVVDDVVTRGAILLAAVSRIQLGLCVPRGKPVEVFVGPWRLERAGLVAPEPRGRIHGVFLLAGRSSGGNNGVADHRGRGFG